ncbi:hypothetical protein QCA50_016694 [Cerrena zonata]|uniref:Uncharacterized protein n=1 Tax=Cerrena zonata TaxID=2478898 RepID=A0AAW0FU02_9APHY
MISGSMERNVLEFANHLHEHFVHPCSIRQSGRYNIPDDPKGGYSIEMHEASIKHYEWPNGSYWVNEHPKILAQLQTAAA